MAQTIRKGTKVRFREGRGWITGKVIAIDGGRATIETTRLYPGAGPAGEARVTSRALDKLERAA